MSQSPFISICIPVFNGATYLSDSIESALEQTYPFFEVLIVDDNSMDNSYDIISKYSHLDSRIHFYRNENRLGLVQNWNRCIELAKGEWIKFLFQDDLLEHDCLEKMIVSQQQSPNKEIVLFCKRDFIFESTIDKYYFELAKNYNKGIWDIIPNKVHINPLDTINFIVKFPVHNVFGEPSSFLIHKSIFSNLGPFDDSLYHICDLEYWLRIGINYNMLLVPHTLVHFRLHKNSTSNFNRREKWLERRYLDRLILYNKFIHDENYNRLRLHMKSWPCNIYLETKAAIYARRAKIAVEEKKDLKWSETFINFCKEYRNLKSLSNRNLMILVFSYITSISFLKVKLYFEGLYEKFKKK
jgi:glycosyltransferase involved in cell wall biosynthesis